jgi:hypothetical protein
MDRQYLFLLQPTTVLAAQVAMDTVVYPIDTVLIDDITTGDPLLDVRAGMTVLFGSAAGAGDLGRTYVRRQPQTLPDDQALVYIGLCSQGRRDGEIDISDGVHVTVLDDYRVWVKPQVMAPNLQGGVDIFKDSDIPAHYGGGTWRNNEPPPVANCGPGVAAHAINGSFTFPFSAAGSFAVAPGATISTYAWDVGDGTITNGDAESPSLRASFPAGFRWVSVTVTDSNGRSERAVRPVLVVDPDDDNLTVPAFEIVTRRLASDGQELSVRILSDIPADTYPDGTLAMVWAGRPAPTTVINESIHHMYFVGWLDSQNQRTEGVRPGTLRDTTVNLLDVAGRLRQLPAYAQEIEHSASGGASWLKMDQPSIFRYLHYLLYWHSTALTVADWIQVPQGAGNVPANAADYDFIVLGSAASDLLDQVRTVARSLVPDFKFVCNMWGQLYLRTEPLLLPVADRASQFAGPILDASRYSRLEFDHSPTPTVRAVYGGAVLAGHTGPRGAVWGWAPVDTFGQGMTETRDENQLALNQEDLDVTEGHRYARLNAPYSLFRVTLSQPGLLGTAQFTPDHFQPAGTRWVRVTVPPAVAAQRGLDFTEARFMLREMNIAYRYSRLGIEPTVELTLEKETVGTPAVPYTLEVPMGWTPEIWRRGGVAPENAIAAYEPYRAADLTSSLVNLANPGTFDASSGDLPDFDAGWVFNGVDQYLATGVIPAAGYAMIVAFHSATGGAAHAVAGSVSGAGSAFYLVPRDAGDDGARRYRVGETTMSVTDDGRLEAGVMGTDGSRAWLDGQIDVSQLANWTAANSHYITIGARHNDGAIDLYFAGTVTHCYIYDAPLTPYQTYAIMLGIQADLGAQS